MNKWKKYKLSELCEVGRGSSPRPIADERYFTNGKIPWVKIADATASGKYIYSTREHVNEFGASFSRYLEPGSLIIAASGVSLGQIKFLGVKGCIHDGWLYTSNFNTELIDKEFLYYFLIFYANQFHNFSSGAAIQNINTEILRNTYVPTPSLKTQKKIASILSAYDDLIENNNQRIRLLEEITEGIYKEWFVRFRFPGYKETIVSDGLPVGWKKKKLHEITSIITRGITPNYCEESESLVINQRCVRDNKLNLDNARFQNKKIPNEKMVQYGDILINSTGEGTLGRVAQVFVHFDKLTVDSHVTIVRPSVINIGYLGMTLKNLQYLFENLALGSTGQTELSRNDVGNVLIIIPKEEHIDKFSNLYITNQNEIEILTEKNLILQKARDLLLPRLISGKLDVGDFNLDDSTLLNMAAEPQQEYKKS